VLLGVFLAFAFLANAIPLIHFNWQMPHDWWYVNALRLIYRSSILGYHSFQ
jgi:hypothetical protein